MPLILTGLLFATVLFGHVKDSEINYVCALIPSLRFEAAWSGS